MGLVVKIMHSKLVKVVNFPTIFPTNLDGVSFSLCARQSLNSRAVTTQFGSTDAVRRLYKW